MIPLEASTALATVVGLLCNWKAEREAQKGDKFQNFMIWLENHHFHRLRSQISESQDLSASIKNLLNEEFSSIAAQLEIVARSIEAVAAETEHLSEIKNALTCLANRVSEPGGGIGGDGGGGTIVGNRGTIVGGRGGSGGVYGRGGKGGSGYIEGDDGLIVGGDGGSCPTADGRGGRPAKGPTERFGFETFTWGYGRGGAGASHPEYNRRIQILKQIRIEYMQKFLEEVPFIEAGVDCVPLDWVNQRLVELREDWRVSMGDYGYILPPLEEIEQVSDLNT